MIKCWTGNLNGNYQGLVCATSKEKAATVAGTSLYDFNQYWHKTISVKVSEFKPDTLYIKKFDTNDPWKEKSK